MNYLGDLARTTDLADFVETYGRSATTQGNIMARTTFSGPVASDNGFIGDFTGNITGNVTGTVTGNVDATAGYIQLRTATTTQIADATDSVNTSGKAAGTIVFNTTLGTLKIATGDTATSTWVNADGTTAVTPA